MKLCAALRWKGFYGQRVWTEAEWLAAAAANDVPWSCAQTGEPWGVDDSLACPEECQPGRACFEGSKRVVQTVG